MNERIDELLWQAGGYTKIHNPNDSFLDGRYAITQEQLDKFAELIVKECMGLVDGYTYPVQTQSHTTYHIASDTIKQHFGVEE